MISKPLTDIQLADFGNLLGNVREGRTIKYKQAIAEDTTPEIVPRRERLDANFVGAGCAALLREICR
jgi:hypothetical protein